MLNRPRGEAGFTLVELVIVIGVLGILATLVYPNYIRYRAQSRQSEAKQNLGSIYVAQWSFFADAIRFGSSTQIGFAISGATNRYTYRTHSTDTSGADTGEVALNAGVGTVEAEFAAIPAASTNMGFTATAAANLDNDLILDQWHVNDRKGGILSPDSNDATNP
ncbi:MAG: type IV pilin protein [Nitrospiraceae bacterium]